MSYFPRDLSRRVVFSSYGDLNRVQRALQASAESLFSVLFPSDCRICLQPLTNISTLPVCRACLNRIAPLEGKLCVLCGEKLFGHHFEGESGPLCGLCRQSVPRFRRAVAYGAYEAELRELVHLLKYQGVRPAAKLLGRLVSQTVAKSGFYGEMLVIPVPLSAAKRRLRGFNQAEEIAQAFRREQGNRIQLNTTLLVRIRETVSQTGLTREQRQANLRGAFAVASRQKLQGRTVLLVDDVLTTGATAGECARVLIRAGAKEVFVATVARATRDTEGLRAHAAAGLAGGTTGHA